MTVIQYAQILWTAVAFLGACVCLYTLRIALQIYIEHRRRRINHGRGIIAFGFLRRNIKRSVKMLAFTYAGYLALTMGSRPVIIGIIIGALVLDVTESILELRDDRRLEKIYMEEKRAARQEALQHGFRREQDKRILEEEIE